ncbi:MAG TPA: radical SAM protein [Desulfohalobiaceae bacterium]|nr:radical SAM protein [Desulfohalobiaceae bacterium]
MKIFFIYPNAQSQPGFNYGLAHISSLLKKSGHEVSLWHLCEDLNPLPDKGQFISRVKAEQPDIIGFSVVTNQWSYAQQLAKWAREASCAPLVCGGIHALADPETILKSGLFDYIFRGESEEGFTEFVDKLATGEDISSVRNLGYIDQGQIRINPIRPLPELSSLPMKDYDVFPFQRLIDVKNGWVGLMASRGCPFACTYCFNHQMVEIYKKDLQCSFKELNYVRHFPISTMIEEIKFLLNEYQNIRMFIFDDDLFTYNRIYLNEFCQAYKSITSIPFVANAHFNFFDENRAESLAKANCRIIKFGLESGSERIRREILNRKMKNNKIESSIQVANRYGLHTSVFLMIGLPGEGRDELMATIRLTAESQPGRFRWSFFYPFPGTKAYDITVAMGCLDGDRMNDFSNFTEGSCLDLGEEQNLFLEKVGKILPWFVNAYSNLPVASFYKNKVDEITALDRDAWQEKKQVILNEDSQISDYFAGKGLSHYAVKYNPFMGVISDYFTTEE